MNVSRQLHGQKKQPKKIYENDSFVSFHII